MDRICNNCISGDTLVIVDGVVKPIAELANAQTTFVNGEWTKITNWQHNGQKEVVKITTTLGLELKVTPDHLIKTKNGWIKAGDLVVGQELITLKTELINKDSLIDRESALLLGSLVGDGWLCRNHGTVYGLGFGFAATRLNAWSPMLHHASVLFNSKEKIRLRAGTKNPFYIIDWRNKKSIEFAKMLNKQRIPEIIWKSNQEIWGSYLQGLFSTDGSLYCQYYKNTTQIRIRFWQTTESLIRDVQMMLRLMGIFTQPLRYVERPPYKNLWEICITRINSVRKFAEKIGFVDNRNEKLQEAIKIAEAPPLPDSIGSIRRKVNEIERVKYIENVGITDVYDITIPKTESFFANGILVHNCRLYNDRDNVCGVTVLISGESYELPVLPHHYCHWERIDEEIQADLKNCLSGAEPYFKAKLQDELDKPIEVKQVRMWSDGKNGYIETSHEPNAFLL